MSDQARGVVSIKISKKAYELLDRIIKTRTLKCTSKKRTLEYIITTWELLNNKIAGGIPHLLGGGLVALNLQDDKDLQIDFSEKESKSFVIYT